MLLVCIYFIVGIIFDNLKNFSSNINISEKIFNFAVVPGKEIGNDMTVDNKILKKNRHLFDNGTSKINRVLRNFVPRGSTPRLRWLQFAYEYAPAGHADNEKVKVRTEMFKPKLSLQDKGYRLDNLFKLNLGSPIFGVLVQNKHSGIVQKEVILDDLFNYI